MKSDIKVMDRYIKVDAPNIVWIVDSILNVSDPVPHVRLIQAETSRQITLSIPALRDSSIYKKV
ncbi:MAG: hypothetical protein HON65_07860 [Rhodospirillales bacterium]|jgi:hypothetical protein|nr:hypothetical protein [Rhodospirillales bacterium]